MGNAPQRAIQCRACRGSFGEIVLDLGDQPACDFFPTVDAPGPDPVYPLMMGLCTTCGLAQLLEDPTVPEEPRGVEPLALVDQAADAVSRVADAGLLPAGATVAEYGSPHGGSWLGLLTRRDLVPVPGMATADLIIDCFGLMHAADQAGALAERAARVAPGGTLLLQYHSLDTIVRDAQWNALRHGHYAYYSTTALQAMLDAVGFSPRTAWRFDLYGGTVLLAARRDADGAGAWDNTGHADDAVSALLAAEDKSGVRDPRSLGRLQDDAWAHARALHGWLAGAREAGQIVIGYGAASRAVALLCMAGVDRDLLSAVADAAPAKQGRRMPGTSIPVISPDELVSRRPDVVLVMVSDLMAEIQDAYPQVTAAGGRWVDAARLPD